MAAWSRGELLFLCWTRETGVVPAALVGVLAGLGVPNVELLAGVVALAIVVTLLLQATPAPWLARRLGLLEPLSASLTAVDGAGVRVDAHGRDPRRVGERDRPERPAVQSLAHEPDLRAVGREAGLGPRDLDRLGLVDPDLLLLARVRGDERHREQRDHGGHPAPGDAGPQPELAGEVVRPWDGTRCQGW